MNTPRARRAAATALLSAGAILLLPAAAQADTCMTDDKGNQVCGASGSGPASGPGSYTGFNGVNNGTVGAPGPDGQPLAGSTPPPWMAPGWSPPPVPAGAQPAPNSPGLLTAPPPGAVLPGDVKAGTVPAAPAATPELPPPATAASPAAGSGGSSPEASAPASATATQSPVATGNATPAPTMTAMASHAPPPTKTAEAAPVTESRASRTEPFNPAPLLAGLGGLAIAGAVAWFVPGIRSALAGLLHRGH